MTEPEKLKRVIDGLTEIIRFSWVDTESKPITPQERRALRNSIFSLMGELSQLLGRLD